MDAISDDGQHGITIIAFVGSVFSPYYAWANHKQAANPDNYCCINVAIYTPGKNRWAMTERGSKFTERDKEYFRVGPSALRWDGVALNIQINERSIPFAQKITGTIKVFPKSLFHFSTPLDQAKKHRWGPIAPSARVEVKLSQPNLQWQGHAYLDSNEGDEGIIHGFREWDWARALLNDQSTAVIYDVREKNGHENLLALRFTSQGEVEPFLPNERHQLPWTFWKIRGHLRSETKPKVYRQLENTPFYTRAMIEANWLGQSVMTMHETLNVLRFKTRIVQCMLPWRMPRIPNFFK